MLKALLEKMKLHRLGGIQYARTRGVKVGNNCRFIGYPDFGSEPYLIEIGDHVTIASNVTFITHDGATWCFREKDRYEDVIKYGAIRVGNNCFIGKGTTILPGVTIGSDTVIGAGSMVTKDCAPNSVYAGVPAKYICTLQEYAEKCLCNTPNYDKEAYQKDKKSELTRIHGG